MSLKSALGHGIFDGEVSRHATIKPLEDQAVVFRRKRNCADAAKYTLPYFQVQRAKMILYAADGMPNDQIAACLDTRREVVSMWRKRFFSDRLAGLEEHARSGRPRAFPPRSGRSG